MTNHEIALWLLEESEDSLLSLLRDERSEDRDESDLSEETEDSELRDELSEDREESELSDDSEETEDSGTLGHSIRHVSCCSYDVKMP